MEGNKLRIIPLGGLGEIGLNMMVLECGDSIIVIDCGLMFPEDYMLGVDLVIPDISYLLKNRDKLKAFIITHGHEDHTGALPFVLRELNAPIYATALTISLIEAKLTDFARFSEYGEKGVMMLMSDSTNVEKEGYTLSEKVIGVNLEEIFRKCTGRIIVAAFSSNIHMTQQVFNTAGKLKRFVIPNGKSMVENIRIARTLGYLHAPEGLLADFKDLERLPPEKIVLLTTGSQGEPMSALTRMAMINHLYRRGAEVIYEKVSEVHVSGHASQEELKIMLNLVKPRHFMPIHGEYRHLVRHGRLAEEVGIAPERVIVVEDGQVVELEDGHAGIKEKVICGKVFVDGKGVGDVKDMVLKDRRHLSRDGMVITVVVLDEKTGEIVYGPDIITRGFVPEQESEC